MSGTWLWQNFITAGVVAVLIRSLLLAMMLAAFIISGVGLHRLARRRGLAYPWLVWLPIARQYQLAHLIGRTLVLTPRLRLPYLHVILPLLMAGLVLGSGSFLGDLSAVLAVLLIVLAYSALFGQTGEPRALLYGLLAGLPYISLIGSLLILRLSKNTAAVPDPDWPIFPDRTERTDA